jgi:hypothetical protein
MPTDWEGTYPRSNCLVSRGDAALERVGLRGVLQPTQTVSLHFQSPPFNLLDVNDAPDSALKNATAHKAAVTVCGCHGFSFQISMVWAETDSWKRGHGALHLIPIARSIYSGCSCINLFLVSLDIICHTNIPCHSMKWGMSQ